MGGYQLTYEQIMWMIPRMLFLVFVVVGMYLLLISHFKTKYDIDNIEVNTIRQKAIVCLEENRELNSCLRHNTRCIKISYDDKSFIVNKKNYNQEKEKKIFGDLVLINNEIKRVRIEIV